MAQIVDALVPQAVEELAKVFRVFSQDRIQQRAVEQTIENPATSVAEMIVEVPVVQTQHGVTTHVSTRRQHNRSGEAQNYQGDSAEKEAHHPGENQPGDQAR